jgi:hypothetical protein
LLLARPSAELDCRRPPTISPARDAVALVASATVAGIVRFILDSIAGPFEVATHAFDGVASAQQRKSRG